MLDGAAALTAGGTGAEQTYTSCPSDDRDRLRWSAGRVMAGGFAGPPATTQSLDQIRSATGRALSSVDSFRIR